MCPQSCPVAFTTTTAALSQAQQIVSEICDEIKEHLSLRFAYIYLLVKYCKQEE